MVWMQLCGSLRFSVLWMRWGGEKAFESVDDWSRDKFLPLVVLFTYSQTDNKCWVPEILRRKFQNIWKVQQWEVRWREIEVDSGAIHGIFTGLFQNSDSSKPSTEGVHALDKTIEIVAAKYHGGKTCIIGDKDSLSVKLWCQSVVVLWTGGLRCVRGEKDPTSVNAENLDLVEV